MFREEEPRSYHWSLLALFGHMIGTTAIFLALFFLAWLVEVLLYTLHKVHPFSPEVLEVVRNVELGVVYFDISLCAVVLGSGFVRFVKDLVGGKR